MSRRTRACTAVCAVVLAAAIGHAAGARAQDYPIRVEHALGTTVIAEKPERIATVAWGNHEVPLALGVVPVGFAAANFGDDDRDGLLPWVTERLQELGAGVPPLFDEGDGIDFEAVAATRPDVILAAHSGLSQSDYETLSKIAPVVAYPDQPWTTEWREMIRMNAAGMGMADEGEALIRRLEARIAASVAAHPALKGKRALFVTHLDPRDLSQISFYTDNDTRVRFFRDLGLTSPGAVKEASESGLFVSRISTERVDELKDIDIVVTYGTAKLLDALSTHILTRRMEAISRDAIVLLPNDPLGTAANPTPLGIPYVLDPYLDLLADAVSGTD